MTPEEKARRYDEALEIAKKNYISVQGLYKDSKIGILNVFKNTLETIFPELKESSALEAIDEKEANNTIQEEKKYRLDYKTWTKLQELLET